MAHKFKKHLLIDGYNIIHAWPDLRKSLKTVGLDTTRSKLADIIRVIHDVEKLRLTIVFDGKGSDIEIERPTPEKTFSLLFTPRGMSADTLIEQLAINSKKGQEIIIATDDSMINLSASSSGAIVISSQALLDWVNACQERQVRLIKDHQSSIQKSWKQQSPWDILK
ncbi:MAG: RNA-binding protein [Verrucomicrobia bacterium]|nr:MAG: RNA-binding protein [Verrucomicrobiota bacterium]